MICYVDLEHPELGPSMLSEGPEATQRKADLLTFKARFERLSGTPCLLLHFTQVDRALLDRLGVRAVVVSGHSTLIDDYDPPRPRARSLEVIRETSDAGPRPLRRAPADRARVRGHARAHGPARRRARPIPSPISRPACARSGGRPGCASRGGTRSSTGSARPWSSSNGTSGSSRRVPAGFVRLATSEACPIQAIRHAEPPALRRPVPPGALQRASIRTAGPSWPTSSGSPARRRTDRERPRWPEPEALGLHTRRRLPRARDRSGGTSRRHPRAGVHQEEDTRCTNTSRS